VATRVALAVMVVEFLAGKMAETLVAMVTEVATRATMVVSAEAVTAGVMAVLLAADKGEAAMEVAMVEEMVGVEAEVARVAVLGARKAGTAVRENWRCHQHKVRQQIV